MRLLVCGGRRYSDRDHVFSSLDRAHAKRPVTLLIHGAGTGADALADQWARSRGVPVKAFPADWDRYGRGAGPIRNRAMLYDGQPEGVVAFPGGAGTGNMVALARERCLPVWKPRKSDV